MRKPAPVIWLTGLSGSGKSTLATELSAFLKEHKIIHQILDGDIVRTFFEDDLGFSREDRTHNIKRITFGAYLLSVQGITTIVSNIAPYRDVRKFVRRKLPNYIQIYLRADVDALMRRDPKGLYKKYNEGKMRNLIGVDDPYEEPQNADLIIDTAKVSIEEASRTINNYLKDKLSNES